MRVLSLLFLIAVVGALGYLGYQNSYSTQLTVWDRSFSVPIPLLVGAVYVLGMLTGGALVGALKRSWHRVTEPDRA
ncbi:MAG: hypothetical protein C0501_26010 [Isosphaera sp.]|nr:hypothetical protein [Isosphaera sp.]